MDGKSKSDSNPNFLIVVIALVIAIVIMGGSPNEKENVEPSSTFKANAVVTQNGNSMQVSDADFNNLTMLVLAEAGSQPYDGQVAVAATALNRFKEWNYASIYDTIFAPGQFSCCVDGYFCHANGVPLSFESYPQDMINSAMSAVEDALKGKDPTRDNLGGGSLYYYNPDYTSDYELSRRANIQKTYRIGDHVFYREWNR